MRIRLLTGGLLPVLLLPVLLAGCTKSGDDGGVATVDGTAAPRATTTLSFEQQGLLHARCMREHGVPEADPQVDGDRVRVGGGYDKESIDPEVLGKAMAACKQYEPVLSPDEMDKKLGTARDESRCMRAQGVEDFPDPASNGAVDVPEAVRMDPQYEAAESVCIRHGGRVASPTPSGQR
ncbi:hypothetical protein ACFPIJ_37985 [Dactylosporangium cerinum]|uniref:Lipoprotein n=1 Tax=Dactylosporangium cerinum TaxID=1434730 RepID=A0ABV9W8Y3_9ACTN